MEAFYKNREQAGLLLAERLKQYENCNAVVVGIVGEGIPIATTIAEVLKLPLEIIACNAINDPSDKSKSIGSVSLNDTTVHTHGSDIPQDYIYHQQVRLQNEIRNEIEFYYKDVPSINYHYKTVIIASDLINTADALLSCIHEIRKAVPLKIIVASAVIDAKSAIVLYPEIDEVLFLQMNKSHSPFNSWFQESPNIDQEYIRRMLKSSKSFKKGLELH